MPQSPRKAIRAVAPPSAPAQRMTAPAPKAPAAGTGKTTTFDPHLELDEALPDGITVLDFLLATDTDEALRLKALRVNGKPRSFDAVPIPGDDLEYYVGPKPAVTLDWLGLVKTGAARQIILRATGLLSEPPARYASSGTKREHEAMAKKDKTGGDGIDQAKAETTRRGDYKQPGREGKKLIGAYVDVAEAELLKAVLKARGTTVQDFFAAAVTTAIMTEVGPAERDRLIEAQVARYRATLRATLKK